MDLKAYVLTADYAGDVDVEHSDGTRKTVPRFQGGTLAVGDGDFHVADQLAAGGGTIVVYEHDQALVDLLEIYPALKSAAVPKDATPVNPYARRTLDDLRHLASLRDLPQAGSLSRRRLEAALLAADLEQIASLSPSDAAAAADASVEDPGDTSDAGDSDPGDNPGVGDADNPPPHIAAGDTTEGENA